MPLLCAILVSAVVKGSGRVERSTKPSTVKLGDQRRTTERNQGQISAVGGLQGPVKTWEPKGLRWRGQEEHTLTVMVTQGSTLWGLWLWVDKNTKGVASLVLVLGMPGPLPALQYSVEIPKFVWNMLLKLIQGAALWLYRCGGGRVDWSYREFRICTLDHGLLHKLSLSLRQWKQQIIT